MLGILIGGVNAASRLRAGRTRIAPRLRQRIAAEERLVVQRYPEYAAYAARTKRLIPRVF